MCLPGIIDSEILSGIFSAGSRCLYSFSNKQTSLKMHATPIILTDHPTQTRDPRFLSMNVGSQCVQAGLSLPFRCHLAPLSMTLAQDVARWSQDRACPAICYASASWAVFWPKARHWTPTLSPSLKAIRDSAKLLITFWKKSVAKN